MEGALLRRLGAFDGPVRRDVEARWASGDRSTAAEWGGQLDGVAYGGDHPGVAGTEARSKNVAVACEVRLDGFEIRLDEVVASVVAVMSFDLDLDSSATVASASGKRLEVTALKASLENKHHLIGR